MGEIINCPGCGKLAARERDLAEYDFFECGLPGVTLRWGAVETACSDCGEKYFHVRKEGQVLQLLALSLLTSPHHLLGSELRYLRGACELMQEQLAKILKCRRAGTAS